LRRVVVGFGAFALGHVLEVPDFEL